MTVNTNYSSCFVCDSQQAEIIPSTSDEIHQKCSRCGEFIITGSAQATLNTQLLEKSLAKVSGWVSEQNRLGVFPTITANNLEKIIERPLPSIMDRATKLLLEAERGLNHFGEVFNINEPRFLAATYSSSQNDVMFLFNILIDEGLATTASSGYSEIRPQGYIKLEELKGHTSTSSQGFVAMWFDGELNEIFTNGFESGIFAAGYDPLRIDGAEHINKIDDEIIKQINASKFIVADFTGHRGGVYFEAGYAMGNDIPVFWTCREDDMSELHFDIRQFNCIDWRTPEDLATRLATRIEAVLGPGPNKT